jgi:hypothetical protein
VYSRQSPLRMFIISATNASSAYFLYWPKKPVVNCFIFMRVFLELVKRGGDCKVPPAEMANSAGDFFVHKSSRLFIRVSNRPVFESRRCLIIFLC